MSEDDALRRQLNNLLQLLAKYEGIQRPNLVELLKGELAVLATGWRLNLGASPDELQTAIYEQLMADLRDLAPPRRLPQSGVRLPPDQRTAQFRIAVCTLFNAHRPARRGTFATKLLEERYAWLDSDEFRIAGVDCHMNDSAARRDFNFARAEIAKVLARRVRAAAIARGTAPGNGSVMAHPLGTSTNEVPSTDAVANSEDDTEAPAQLGDLSSRPRAAQHGRRRTVLFACGGTLVLIGALATAGKLSGLIGGTASNADPISSTSAQLPVVSSATGPAMVTSVAFMRDNGTLGAWSYAFPKTLSPANMASYSAVSQNEQQYQQWAFDKGGVTADDVRLQIGLRGNQSGTVVVQDIQITKHCQAPLTGTLLYVPPQGQTGDLGIDFDLDQQFPVAEDADTHASYFGASGEGHTITLAHGEVATLLLDVDTSRYYCTFSFSLDINTDTGQQVSEVVNDQGKPFQVTATAGTGTSIPFSLYRALYVQNGAENALVPANPATFGKPFATSTTNTGG